MSEPTPTKTAAQPETSTISVARYCDGKSTFFSVKRGGETLYRFPNEREANQFKRSLERAQCSPPKSERTYTADEVAKLLAASERTARAHAAKLAAALRDALLLAPLSRQEQNALHWGSELRTDGYDAEVEYKQRQVAKIESAAKAALAAYDKEAAQ